MYHPFLLLKKRRAFKYKWRTLHLVCWNVFHFNVLVLFRSLSNFAGWPFKNKSLLCKHCDKLAFLIAWKIYFRRNSCRSKQNILSWVMNMKVWIHLRDHFDYHKLIETKNEKLINYAPHHHMFLYLQIIISSEAANLDILGFYTGPERYFCRLFEFAVDLNEMGTAKLSTFDTFEDLQLHFTIPLVQICTWIFLITNQHWQNKSIKHSFPVLSDSSFVVFYGMLKDFH